MPPNRKPIKPCQTGNPIESADFFDSIGQKQTSPVNSKLRRRPSLCSALLRLERMRIAEEKRCAFLRRLFSV
jgi:hypothetical protein